MKSGPTFPFRLFFCLLLSQDFTDFFFNIFGQHCFQLLNYSVAQPGADKAYWLIDIILHFVLGFIDLC